MNTKALGAEFIGSFLLVCAICGAVLFAPGQASVALNVSLAAGLSLLAMTFVFIDVSGGHFNPAVTLGLVAGGRIDAGEAVGYVGAQVVGGIAGAALIFSLADGGGASAENVARLSNVYGTAGYAPLLVIGVIEVLFTGLFVVIFMGATSQHNSDGSAAIAIAAGFAVLHFIAFPITGVSMNPARSTATALFAGASALSQLWLFWVAPITGGIIGGLAAKWLYEE